MVNPTRSKAEEGRRVADFVKAGATAGVFRPKSARAATVRVGCLSLAATQGLEEWLPVRRGFSNTTPRYRTRLTGPPANYTPLTYGPMAYSETIA